MAIADQHKIAATGSVTPALLQRPRGATAEMAVTMGDAFADVFRLMAQATPRPTESSGGQAGEVPSSTDGRQESSPTEEAESPEGEAAADASAPRLLAQSVTTAIAPAAVANAAAAETTPQSADAPELQTPVDAAQPAQNPQQTAAHSPAAAATDGLIAEQPVTAAAVKTPPPSDPVQGSVAVQAQGPATDLASEAAGGTALPGQDQQQPDGGNRGQPALSEHPSANPRAVAGEGNAAPAAQAAEQRTAQPQAGADGGDSGGQDHRSRRSERSGRRRSARSETVVDPQRSPSPRADASAPAEVRPPTGAMESAALDATPAADAAQPARAAAASGGLTGATAAAAGSAAAKAASAAPAATVNGAAASGADAITSPAITGSKPAAASGSRSASGGDEASGSSVADRARLVQRVSKAFQRMGQDGGRIRIRLHPAELGSVRLEMQVQGKEVRARVVVETEAARGLLREHLHELRSRLSDQGMHIQHLDVELGDATQGGAEQGSQQSSLGYPSPDERREAARLGRPERRGVEPGTRDGESPVRLRGTTAARLGGVDLMV